LVRRSDGLHLAVARQRKDASPCQAEAGAQRRVRVHPAVHVGATRCVALTPSCTTEPQRACSASPPPPGDPPGRPYISVGVGCALQHRLTRQQNDRLIARALLLVAGSPYGRAKFCDSNGSFTGTNRWRTRNCATVSAATLCPAAVQ
jgi:hypothetical protein